MRRLVTDSIQKLRPYVAGKPLEELARERGVTDAVKLASNENPLGPSPRVVAAITQAAGDVHRYPDAEVFALRKQLAERLGVAPNEIVFGNGSNELLDLIYTTFATPSAHAVFADPSFVVYGMSALAHAVPHTTVPLRDHRHDLPAMLQAVQEHTSLVFIANPNNPTGSYVTRDELTSFLERLPPDVIAVVDEAYFEYATAEDYPDTLQLRGLHERLIVLRTFSKAYGLAGLRIGYAVAPPELCDFLNRVRAPFNANSLAQVAAIAALNDQDHLSRCRELNAAQLQRVERGLAALGLSVVPSQANFVLVELGRPAAPVFDALLNEGVITRLVPPLPDALRISIGTAEENTRLLAAMEKVLQ